MQGQWLWRRSVVAGLVLALTACSPPSETKDPEGISRTSLVRLVPESAGTRCPQGGTAIQTGLDDNGDGVLGDDEVTQTSYLCGGGTAGGQGGAMSLVKMTPEAAGSRCATGGTAVVSGLDTNADGVQGESEVTSTQYVCNHEDGTSGGAYLVKLLPETSGANCSRGGTAVLGGIDVNTNAQLEGSEVTAKQYVCDPQTAATTGPGGANSLIRQDVEPWGANCAQGGTAVKSGLDTNGSGSLETSEVTNTTFVCNGLRGSDGQNGKNSLVRMEAEPAGKNCPSGGTIIGSGLDVNGDRLLNDSEVTSIQYVCSAAALFRTKWANNPPGTFESGEIANLWVPVSRRVTIYKTKDTSRLKVTVSDNFRVGSGSSDGTGIYSVRMNGSSMGCEAHQHNWSEAGWRQNYHFPLANVCLTEQLPKGLYEFDVWAYGNANPPYSGTSYVGAATGGNALLLAEELDDTQPYAFTRAGSEYNTSSTSAVKASGRELVFTKQSPSTLLKVTLADTLRVGFRQNGGLGTVSLRLDGVATNCYTGKYDGEGAGGDFINPFVMTCILPNVSASRHSLDVTLTANSGGAAQLGWQRSSPLLLVEELPSTGRSYSNTSGASGDLSGSWAGVNGRQVTHYVSSVGKTLKVTYSDTFRAVWSCNGRWGMFQLYVDYQPVNCSNGQHVWNSGGVGQQDHHHPTNLTCIVPNLTPGYHSFSIWSTTVQQGDGSSCGSNSFGWNRGQNLLLVEDLP